MSDRSQTPLPQNATIGIIGGGQLGRMLCIAAAELGYRSIILEPDINAPAAQVANDQIMAAYDDSVALESLASQADMITYEFENVPAGAIHQLEALRPVHPNSHALTIAQDRLLEKQMAQEIGAQPAAFFPIDTLDDLKNGLAQTGYPAILKTRRLGYDGKGQVKIDKPEQAEQAFEAMNGQDAILEAFVNFDCEISIIAARNQDGTFVSYDLVENVHEHHILARSTVPARIHPHVAQAAQTIADKIARHLNYVGVFAVEFFVEQAQSADFSIYVNEMAPRVHNSGHWTEAACIISQFEQHIRAIAGLPLMPATRHSNCVMQNLIGDQVNNLTSFLENPDAKIQLYGKQDIRTGRKMGHVTIISKNSDKIGKKT